jgi:CRP/FNR family transcriptional regulator, cyclic AMP receptor protein
MTMPNDPSLHPFLRGLDPKHLEILGQCSMAAHFDPGHWIFRVGDPANRFYLIHDGPVALESSETDTEPVLVQTLGAGDVLGWSWLFPPYVWHFDARAAQPTQATFFYGARLREACEQDHCFGHELMKRTAAIAIERLQATRKALLKLERQLRPTKDPP